MTAELWALPAARLKTTQGTAVAESAVVRALTQPLNQRWTQDGFIQGHARTLTHTQTCHWYAKSPPVRRSHTHTHTHTHTLLFILLLSHTLTHSHTHTHTHTHTLSSSGSVSCLWVISSMIYQMPQHLAACPAHSLLLPGPSPPFVQSFFFFFSSFKLIPPNFLPDSVSLVPVHTHATQCGWSWCTCHYRFYVFTLSVFSVGGEFCRVFFLWTWWGCKKKKRGLGVQNTSVINERKPNDISGANMAKHTSQKNGKTNPPIVLIKYLWAVFIATPESRDGLEEGGRRASPNHKSTCGSSGFWSSARDVLRSVFCSSHEATFSASAL